MKKVIVVVLGALGLWAAAAPPAHAGTRVGIGLNFGFPCYYRPYPVGWGYYYRPYPVYVAPAPVIVEQPAAVVVQPAPTYRYAPPAPEGAPAPRPLEPVSVTDGDQYARQLADPNEAVRQDAVMQLGRMKAVQSVDAVAATLAGDRNPAVREAAARSLGLMGSPKALTALKYAAQADADRDVRRSAQFAVEVIQTNLRR